MQNVKDIKEGDLYKTVCVEGQSFDLYYGYYDDFERESALAEPIPIYPDFILAPVYTEDGSPYVTQMQTLCEYGESEFEDGCCVDCKYFKQGEELIGTCVCENNKRKA